MFSWTLPCPAKINLGLRVLRRRPDGYHDLQTVFQLLDYGDELSIAPATSLSLNDLPGWLMDRARDEHGKEVELDAARALVSAIGSHLGVLSTELEKLASFAGEREVLTVAVQPDEFEL